MGAPLRLATAPKGVGCGAGLIDFGQSKQLTEEERLAFARLVLALSAAEGAELLEVMRLRAGPVFFAALVP